MISNFGFGLCILLFVIPSICNAQEITSVKDSTSLEFDPDLGVRVFQVDAQPEKGFNYPYLIRIPSKLRYTNAHLLVEPNNTGTATDDYSVHITSAQKLISISYPSQISEQLQLPLLIPVFPRPRTEWRCYIHALDDDCLKVNDKSYKRVDLQLIAMIKDAQALLKNNQYPVADQVIMHGFSASGTFVNRFAVLHPVMVRACAAGGVNAIPILPIAELTGNKLYYPIGISDVDALVGNSFDAEAYQQVSQFIYMGDFDRNDATLYRDAFSLEQSQLVHKLLGKEMPDRWKKVQRLFGELEINAQLVTYNATGHEIRKETIDDIVKFLSINLARERKTIKPHQHKYVEFKELKAVQVTSVLLKGDEQIPRFARNLINGQGTLTICVKDWIKGRDYKQLEEFFKNYGFDFELISPNGKKLKISKSNYLGTISKGDGSFQGFVVTLELDALKQLKTERQWRLKTADDLKKTWVINDNVFLVIPEK